MVILLILGGSFAVPEFLSPWQLISLRKVFCIKNFSNGFLCTWSFSWVCTVSLSVTKLIESQVALYEAIHSFLWLFPNMFLLSLMSLQGLVKMRTKSRSWGIKNIYPGGNHVLPMGQVRETWALLEIPASCSSVGMSAKGEVLGHAQKGTLTNSVHFHRHSCKTLCKNVDEYLWQIVTQKSIGCYLGIQIINNPEEWCKSVSTSKGVYV